MYLYGSYFRAKFYAPSPFISQFITTKPTSKEDFETAEQSLICRPN